MNRLLLAVILLATACGGGSSAADDNKTACDDYRNHIGALQTPLSDLGKGTATVGDVLGPVKSMQTRAEKEASYATGTVKVNIQAVADDLGRLRVALTGSGLAGVTDAMSTQTINDLTAMGDGCKSIGH